MGQYQPKTGARCTCKPGVYRDNCPNCEGTGWVIDFQAIHEARKQREEAGKAPQAAQLPWLKDTTKEELDSQAAFDRQCRVPGELDWQRREREGH